LFRSKSPLGFPPLSLWPPVQKPTRQSRRCSPRPWQEDQKIDYQSHRYSDRAIQLPFPSGGAGEYAIELPCAGATPEYAPMPWDPPPPPPKKELFSCFQRSRFSP